MAGSAAGSRSPRASRAGRRAGPRPAGDRALAQHARALGERADRGGPRRAAQRLGVGRTAQRPRELFRAGTRRPRRGRPASRPCRRARRGSGSPRAPRARGSRSSVRSSASRPDEALHERDERRGVAHARLRVHDPHLDRAQPRLQPHVPPQERRLGDRVAAQQQVDRLGVLARRSRSGAACPCAGRPGTAGCARDASPLSRPCQKGELADSASSSGRCARMRL